MGLSNFVTLDLLAGSKKILITNTQITSARDGIEHRNYSLEMPLTIVQSMFGPLAAFLRKFLMVNRFFQVTQIYTHFS